MLAAQQLAMCLIDKEGDAARLIANSMPCVDWRARDYDFPIGLNLLQNVQPDDRSTVSANVVSTFAGIWVERTDAALARLSPDQAEFARRAQDAGVRYFVVPSIDDVQNLAL